MSIPNSGFVVHVTRLRNEQRGVDTGKRYRTVGKYQCFFNGDLLDEHHLRGATAEARGPGDNTETGVKNARRIEAGTYQIGSHFPGGNYRTYNYNKTRPKPGLLINDTGARTFILIHPGTGFKSSVGCINLTGSLVGPHDDISYRVSYGRVETLFDRMKQLMGAGFPTSGSKKMNAWLVIDGEPID